MGQIQSLFNLLMWIFIVLIVLTLFFLQKGRKRSKKKKKFNRNNGYKPNSFHNNKFSEASIIRASKVFGQVSKCSIAFDTNVLLDYPNIISSVVQNANVMISDKVRKELDKIKDRQEEISKDAAFVLKTISSLHKENKVQIIRYDLNEIEGYGLDKDSNDDVIVGSYLSKAKKGEKVVFITNDSNARTTARVHGLFTLELDWEKEIGTPRKIKSIRNSNVKRPGYAYKLFSLVCFSIAVGVLWSMAYLQSISNVDLVIGETSSSTKASSIAGSAKYVNGNYPYEVKSEYGETFKGKRIGDLGAGAIVDISYNESFGARLLGNYTITMASWFDKDPSEKNNQYKYIIVDSSSKVYEARTVNSEMVTDGTIYIESLDSNIKFINTNGYENIYYTFEEDELKKLDGAELHIVHKVTNKVIQKFPLKVLKK
ncbi:hypothetical protein PB1_02580 [Bacillus methanolicus PB1]|uniref:PIN domain-containing protein n=1 Tax=Bacillus methanolicus PB1 TaxID=997296 RepID=I3E5L8_BACMT|nr:PIN domain-containing protein [Bacillus methanolicus]EIJ81789.1 hypothetical protein PB1_02580 [Bacillus methanolicus PB1]